MRLKGGGPTVLGYHDHYVVDGGKQRIILAALVTPADVMEKPASAPTCRYPIGSNARRTTERSASAMTPSRMSIVVRKDSPSVGMETIQRRRWCATTPKLCV